MINLHAASTSNYRLDSSSLFMEYEMHFLLNMNKQLPSYLLTSWAEIPPHDSDWMHMPCVVAWPSHGSLRLSWLLYQVAS